jgi:hypothetical protein
VAAAVADAAAGGFAVPVPGPPLGGAGFGVVVVPAAPFPAAAFCFGVGEEGEPPSFLGGILSFTASKPRASSKDIIKWSPENPWRARKGENT